MSTRLSALRVTVGSLFSAVFVIAIALWFVLPHEVSKVAWHYGLPVLFGLGSYGVCTAIGYRTKAIAPGTDKDQAAAASANAFQQGTFLRFALCEATVLLSIIMPFVISDAGYAVFLIGAVIGLLLMARFVWPGEHNIAQTQAALEREGGTSYLRDGLAASSTAG